MTEIELIEKLDKLVEEIVATDTEVTFSGKPVKILNHSLNRVTIERADGKQLTIGVFGTGFSFFESYKINNQSIIKEYTDLISEFNEAQRIAQEEIEKMKEEITYKMTKVSKSNIISLRPETSKYVGHNQLSFIYFILNETSPLTKRKYSKSSASVYNREICNILDSGVTVRQLQDNIDQFIFDYSDPKGSMKSYNVQHHSNPSAALILYKKHLEELY